MASIFLEVKEFLNYVLKSGRDKKKRSWSSLKRRFGRKKYDRLYDFCTERGYIGSLPYREDGRRDHYIYVKTNGFGFLEEERRREDREKEGKKRLENSRISMIASVVMAIATVLLLISTAVYTYHTQNIAKINIENSRPYVSIVNLSYETPEWMGLPGFIIELENKGQSPAIVEKIKISIPSTEGPLTEECLGGTVFEKERSVFGCHFETEILNSLEPGTISARIRIEYKSYGEYQKELYFTERSFWSAPPTEGIPRFNYTLGFNKFGEMVS